MLLNIAIVKIQDEEDVETSNLARNIDILVKIGELLPLESLQAVVSMHFHLMPCCELFEIKSQLSLLFRLLPGMNVVNFMWICNLVWIKQKRLLM